MAEPAAPPSPWPAFVVVAAAVIALDQATKLWILAELALHDSIVVVDGFFRIVHVRNPGAAFSLLAQAPDGFRAPFFLVVTTIAIAFVLYVVSRLSPEERPLRFALGGVLGGAVGNLIDRLLYGEVIDFLDVHWHEWHWPAFNVADSAISVSVAAIVLYSFIGKRVDRS